jgi:peptidoglycan/xylan/chitin deacetylase (PgdA/CDA1 family)
MKRLVKKIFSKESLLFLSPRKKFIFIYHDISNKDSGFYSQYYSTSPENFKKQIMWIRENFNLISMNELVSDKIQSTKPSAAIVFDDGFKSVLTNAYPLMAEQNIPVTVFVNKSAVLYNKLWVTELMLDSEKKISKYKPELKLAEKDLDFQNKVATNNKSDFLIEVYLNKSDVLALSEKGVDIQSHSCNHYNMQLCTTEQMKQELIENKTFIEELTQKEVKHFAIPFGKKEHYNNRLIDIARSTGHDYIYSSNPIGFFNANKLELIPRIGLTEESVEEIIFMLNRQQYLKIDI